MTMDISEKIVDELMTYYQEKRYQDVKDRLNALIDKDPNNYHIYYWKALCCISMLQFDEALLSLGEGAYLYPDYVPSMHALAYIFLKQGDFESAMDKWLAIKTIASKDPLVNQILNKIKSGQLKKDPLNRYAQEDFIQPDLKELKKGLLFTSMTPHGQHISVADISPASIIKPALSYSSPPKKKNNKKTGYRPYLWGGVLVIVLSLVFLRYSYKKSPIPPSFQDIKETPILFSFRPEEIQSKQKELFSTNTNEDYNQKIIHANELIYSNASEEIKKQALHFRMSLQKPQTLSDLGSPVSLSTLLKNPYLYQGVFLHLQGMIDNFLKRPQYISFDIHAQGAKIANIYFFDRSTDTLPFQNKDVLSIFGSFSLDENHQPVIEDKTVSLVQSSDRILK